MGLLLAAINPAFGSPRPKLRLIAAMFGGGVLAGFLVLPIVRFVDDPGYYLVEYMPGLLAHLRDSGMRTVPVAFVFYYDPRGRFKGYSVMNIDSVPYRPDPQDRRSAGQQGTGALDAFR